MQFGILSLLASIIVVSFGATVQDVLNDIAAATTQALALENAIDTFPTTGGTLADALAIHQDALNTASAVDKATDDAKTVPTPVSETDAISVFDAVLNVKPIIEGGLTDIVSKKPEIDALPIGGLDALVEQDLVTLNTSVLALGDVLIADAPADLLPNATALRAEIAAAFATAIAAFAD